MQLISKNRKRTPGQSGSEYALAIGLVAVVAITGLGAMGLNLSGIFSGMITNQSPAPVPPPPVNLPPAPPPAVVEPPAVVPPAMLANFPPAPPGTEGVCFDGLCVHLPVVDETNEVVDTAGGNGVEKIHQFSNVLDQIAEQLSQEEGVDQTLVTLISNLANNGHGLGDQQAVIAKLPDTSFNAGLSAQYNREKSAFNSAFTALNTYLEKNPGKLSPTAQTIVSTQASQIKKLASAVNIFVAGKGGTYTSTGKATLTHQSANTVCQQGGENCTREVSDGTP